MSKNASAKMQNLPPTQKRRLPDDPTLLSRTFQTVLRAQAKHRVTLPWASARELADFLGPRPDSGKALVQRHNPNLPHGLFNTCWTGQPDSDYNKKQRREQSKALKEARKAPYKAPKQRINTNPAYVPKNGAEALKEIDREQVTLLRRAINPCKQKRHSEP